MTTILATLTFGLILATSAINPKNNACPKFNQYPLATLNPKCYVNPDVFSDVVQVVTRNGYNVKTHSVVTDDGYILTLFEIWGKFKNESKNFTVFLQHGLLVHSGVWVITGRRSLAFYLADLGYKVWLGNIRGTLYSQKHVNLTVNDPKYWNFTLDTVAAKDIKTQLRFVAKTSGLKIHYIGYSMGTTIGLMFLASSGQEDTKSLQSASLFAPVAYLNNIIALQLIETPGYLFTKMLTLLNITGLFYQEKLIHRVLVSVCKRIPNVCFELLIEGIFGKSTHFSSTDLLLYFGYWPGGVSVNQIQHYLQLIKSRKFQKFDYGPTENLKEYGTENPPTYNLSRIKLPVCLFYGENDAFYKKEVSFRKKAQLNKFSIFLESGETVQRTW
ncbi:gastric triacylglycerol lipase-like [Zophobas morio]|uniref:gastric triacylglycerol lipase-like n=1 Tax=Zophobas morio TaxID=2755281 RepID=UPI003082E536